MENSGFNGIHSDADIEEHATIGASFEKEVRPFIDLIDELSSYGLAEELNLPSVVVIGDQSSGKSSILEAISGIQLPRGTDITTRCPIEMHLKKVSGASSAVIKYTDMKKNQVLKTIALDSLEKELIKAQDAITKAGDVTDSKIVLDVQGPSCPDVSLTDLPGIVRTTVNDDVTIISRIRNVINNSIKGEHVLIMCIIPANLDLATNEALTIAKQEDPLRERTIGIFTKPDLIEWNPECKMMEYMENKVIPLGMGYHVVRCRTRNESKLTHAEAIRQEKKFFKEHSHFRKLKPEVCGTESLSTKLTQYLVRHVKAQLPNMLSKTRTNLASFKTELEALGSSVPLGEEAKRRFMIFLLEETLKNVTKYLIDGRRIPISVIKSEHVLVEEMDVQECKTNFMWRSLFEHFATEIHNITTGHLNFVNGELSVGKIEKQMIALRGNELPRFFNFDLFEELIQCHLKQYEAPALDCLNESAGGVEKIAMFVCKEKLRQWPNLLQTVQDECCSVLEQCKATAKEMLLRDLRKERRVYTQDATYLTQIRQFVEKENTPKSASSSVSGADSAKHLSVRLLNGDGSEGNEDRHNAEVMHHIVTVYLNVVNMRLSDAIPQTIRLDLYENFVEKITDNIRSIFLNGSVDLIDEDDATAGIRRDLQTKISVFEKARKKLSNFDNKS